MPAVGYTTPTSRTSPRATTGRSARSTRGSRTGWLGRYLDRVGTQRQPAPGALARLPLPPALASHEGAGRGDRRARRVQLLGAGRLGRRRGPDARDARRARRAPRRPDPAPGGEATRSRPPAPPARALRQEQRQRLRQPGRVPRRRPTRSRASSPGSPRCSPRACRSAASRSPRRAPTTPTPTSRRRSPTGLKLTARTLLAFQRDLEARGLADRVLDHVWSEFGRRARGERLAAPTTAPPASAS